MEAKYNPRTVQHDVADMRHLYHPAAARNMNEVRAFLRSVWGQIVAGGDPWAWRGVPGDAPFWSDRALRRDRGGERSFC